MRYLLHWVFPQICRTHITPMLLPLTYLLPRLLLLPAAQNGCRRRLGSLRSDTLTGCRHRHQRRRPYSLIDDAPRQVATDVNDGGWRPATSHCSSPASGGVQNA